MDLLPWPREIEMPGGACAPRAAATALDASIARPQGYELTISPGLVRVVGHDEPGLHYGLLTLEQIRAQSPAALPCLKITDWPDFPVRGVMLDISRDKVPTMPTLYGLVDRLAGWKINHLQLYMEHTFAYRDHRDVWKDASPITSDEIRALDQYCRQRHVELAANQNSFGHMERWLKWPAYRGLAETTDGADTPWGYRWKGPFSLCPTDAASVEFLRGLYDELLPNFSSRLFNVGCDETFDIGQGRSRADAEKIGKHRVYLQFLKQVHRLVSERGKTMMFWGDIILHEPELIAELPRPIVALNWGYEADHPFEDEARRFAEAGVPFWVCPGTSSWLSIAGRTDNMLANQIAAAQAGIRRGASGFLNTDWGDHGHLQYLAVSHPALATGAAVSWFLQGNQKRSPTPFLGNTGRCAMELGNVYQAVRRPWKNSTALFRILVPSSTHKNPLEKITVADLQRALDAIESVGPIPTDSLEGHELAAAAQMMRYACRLGMWRLEPATQSKKSLEDRRQAIVREHRRLWLARNRPGGLDDSAARLESL